MQAVPKAQYGTPLEGIGNYSNQTLSFDCAQDDGSRSKNKKMRNSVENQNRIGEMSVRYHYEVAQTSEATKRYLWNSRRRFS